MYRGLNSQPFEPRAATNTYRVRIPQLENDGINVVSIRNNQLLAGTMRDSRLFIYTVKGDFVASFSIPGKLFDAVWLESGRIVCTTCDSLRILLLSQSGAILRQMQLSRPRYITVCARNIIYIADFDWGVFRSDDDGFNWRLLFALPDEANACQVVRVPADREGVYWIVEFQHEHWQLREYQPSGTTDGINKSWHCNVTLSISKVNASANGQKKRSSAAFSRRNSATSNGNHAKTVNGSRPNGKTVTTVDLLNCSMTYDGDVSMFVASFSDNEVHVFNTSGGYERRLLSADEGILTPCSLAVDKYRRQLCVGQRGEVLVYQLEDKWWRPSMVFNDAGDYRNSAFSEQAFV
jgi:hypothetical protein